MKALGRIGNIEVTYSQEKTSERDGHKFWYERHTVFFESGDDTHMVTVGTHTQGQGGGIEVLKRRGTMEAKPASSTEVKTEGEDQVKPADGPQSVEEMMADAAADAEEKQGDDLPF